MPEPKKTKGGGKDDGGKPTIPTPEELAKQAEEMPIAGHLARMIEQDRLDGLEEDHQPYEEADEDENSGGSSQPDAQQVSENELPTDEQVEEEPTSMTGTPVLRPTSKRRRANNQPK